MNEWLILIVVFLLALPYLVFPLLIKANMSMKARPVFREIELNSLPGSYVGFFREKVAELEKLGFKQLAVLEAPESGSNVRNYLVLMSLEAEQLLALITGVVGVVSASASADSRAAAAADADAAAAADADADAADSRAAAADADAADADAAAAADADADAAAAADADADADAADADAADADAPVAAAAAPSVFYLEFLSCFSDERRISSMNSPELGSFPGRKGRDVLQVPQIQSGQELLRFHRAAVRNLAGGLKAELPESDDWAAYTQNELSMQFDWVAENTGLLLLDQTKENYRPSWYGAYKLTWMELWPFKPIRRARMKARAAELQRRYLA